MGISEICVQLSLTEIQAASKSILEHFVSSSGLRNIDTTHPQYAAMAVYQMCRLRKIKIQKTKLISFSHLKPSQWAVLEKSWDTWAKANPDKLLEFQTSKKAPSSSHITTEPSQGATTDSGSLLKATIAQPVEEYTVWRERVLKQAFEDLERMKTINWRTHLLPGQLNWGTRALEKIFIIIKCNSSKYMVDDTTKLNLIELQFLWREYQLKICCVFVLYRLYDGVSAKRPQTK